MIYIFVTKFDGFFLFDFLCVRAGNPGAGEPGGDVYHPGRGRLTAMHPGSVLYDIITLSY